MTTAASSPPQPTDVLRYYQRSLEAAQALKKSIGPLVDSDAVASTSRFFGMTAEEFDQALSELRRELDHHCVFMLTASFKAVFQTDLQDRVRRRRKDPLSKALRSWWMQSRRRRKEKWIDLASLLDEWKTATGHRHVIGRLKSLLLFRHWLAHGRYWVERSGLGEIDPLDAWQIGKAVFDVLPEFRPLPAM
jgi:hypothetical protein